MKKILFICVHNSGRSQMAEAFLNRLSQGKAIATSAGTEPGEQVNPTVVAAMREIGIDLSAGTPKSLTFEMLDGVDRVITMGCGASNVCPASFVPSEDWELEDPEGKPIEKVRQIRDEVEVRVRALLKDLE